MSNSPVYPPVNIYIQVFPIGTLPTKVQIPMSIPTPQQMQFQMQQLEIKKQDTLTPSTTIEDICAKYGIFPQSYY